MKAEILIRKKIKARSVGTAMVIIKKKYPRAKMITYKFRKDMRFETEKIYKNRLMDIAFINDVRLIREVL